MGNTTSPVATIPNAVAPSTCYSNQGPAMTQEQWANSPASKVMGNSYQQYLSQVGQPIQSPQVCNAGMQQSALPTGFIGDCYTTPQANPYATNAAPTSVGSMGAGSLSPNLANTSPNLTPNPLSTYAPTGTAQGAVAPNLGVTAGSSTQGTLTQGGALPNITTTQSATTAAPQFYTCYLNNIAKSGTAAAQGAQYVGATDLQNQAFNQVANNAGNYQPTLNAGINTAKGVANSCISQLAQSYMSPYTKCVVNAIGNLGEANIAQNIAPQATAGIVGAGQFGSARGAQALGQTLANAGLGITAQQACALQKGYSQALCAAKAQEQLQLQAGAQLTCQAKTTSGLGIACTNALATLGQQKQTIAQNAQCYPMQQLTNESALLRGYTIPTATSSTYTGPIPGAYATSPLAQISALGTTAAALMNAKTSCGTLGGALATGLGKLINGVSISSNSKCQAAIDAANQGKTTVALPVDPSWGAPVQGTGANGGAGAGQILGQDGNVYTDPTYGTGGGSVVNNPIDFSSPDYVGP